MTEFDYKYLQKIMKPFNYCLFLATAFLFASALEGPAFEITETPSTEEVAQKQASVASAYHGTSAAAPSGKVAIEQPKPSLLAQSEFLIGVYGYCIVPKGASLLVGEKVTVARAAPSSKRLMTWSNFVRSHRADLRLVAITDSQWMAESSLEPLKPAIRSAEESGLTTLLTLNGEVVGIPAAKSLLTPSK